MVARLHMCIIVSCCVDREMVGACPVSANEASRLQKRNALAIFRINNNVMLTNCVQRNQEEVVSAIDEAQSVDTSQPDFVRL